MQNLWGMEWTEHLRKSIRATEKKESDFKFRIKIFFLRFLSFDIRRLMSEK